jgi:hypothetical protein
MNGAAQGGYGVRLRIEMAIESGSQALDLSSLGLRELPECVGHVTGLTGLDISGNQ